MTLRASKEKKELTHKVRQTCFSLRSIKEREIEQELRSTKKSWGQLERYKDGISSVRRYFNQNRVAWPGSKLSKPVFSRIAIEYFMTQMVFSFQQVLLPGWCSRYRFLQEGKESGGQSSGQDCLALCSGKECPQGRKRKVAQQRKESLFSV